MLENILYLIKGLFIAFFIFILMLYRQKPFQVLYYLFKDIKKFDKEEYTNYGFWLYTGLMGSGKTISIAEYIIKIKKQYPKLYVAGNFTHSLIDKNFETWQEMVEVKNPLGTKYGVLIVFDEIHLTFASENWKSAPDNLLETISMSRKNHRHIIASSQVFSRVNIKLREQTNYIIECATILNRWTFNKAFYTHDYLVNADLKDSGIRKRKHQWTYNFVQTDTIRNSYDTYELLEELKPKSDLISLGKLAEALNQ